MGDMFRSEKMALCQLFVQPETAYRIVSELGELGIVQFKDSNETLSAFQKKFVMEVRRCNELDRRLRYIENEIKKDEMKIPDPVEIPKAPVFRQLAEIENVVEKIEGEIRELSNNATNLKSDFSELTELKYVLEKSQQVFEGEEPDFPGGGEEGGANRGHLDFIAGIVKRERMPGFERMLWRISRGNVFLKRVELDESFEDPQTGHTIYKTVFVAFYQGEQLKGRIKKVCSGFRATIHNCPKNSTDSRKMLDEVKARLEDLKTVLNQSNDHRQRVLFGATKDLQQWIVMVKKMKAIYHVLNYFNVDLSGKCMIVDCWIPVRELEVVQNILKESSRMEGSTIRSFLNVIETEQTPPTYTRTNKFTSGFQNLINSYGMGSYREVNPALYTVITFPFLFAVMFGDFGHGLILTLFGLYLVLYEDKLKAKNIKSEIFKIFFGGRYIILLMGLFAIYTGLVYNDLFSKSINVFGSSWGTGGNITWYQLNLQKDEGWDLNPSDNYTLTPYPFGVDPVWQLAKNKIIFLNTYKMKLSIVLGVFHMIFGICMSVPNFVHFKKHYSIYLEFVPQLLFLVCLFLYMVFMIFFKWIVYGPDLKPPYSPGCAPSVLILFINMMLFKEGSVKDDDCKVFMFEGQQEFQYALVAVALVCVPIMLLGKPLYLMCRRKAPEARSSTANGRSVSRESDSNGVELDEVAEQSRAGNEEHAAEEQEPMSEIFIHQAIHTIEYVLSTISHTASYLRLWALSLAHAQLSEVLWNMVMKQGLNGELWVGSVFLFVIFAAWSVLTVSILVMMEGLSAFLHTLRLHWVEFMSKFFEGLGYEFQPFDLSKLADEADEADT